MIVQIEPITTEQSGETMVIVSPPKIAWVPRGRSRVMERGGTK